MIPDNKPFIYAIILNSCSSFPEYDEISSIVTYLYCTKAVLPTFDTNYL
jgi:hypothetical protein